MVAGLALSSISGTRGQHQLLGNEDRFLIEVLEVNCYKQDFSESVGGLAEPVRTLSRTDWSPSCQKSINLFSLMKIRELLTFVYIRPQSARTMQNYTTLRSSSQSATNTVYSSRLSCRRLVAVMIASLYTDERRGSVSAVGTCSIANTEGNESFINQLFRINCVYFCCVSSFYSTYENYNCVLKLIQFLTSTTD
jgi:hypothetical protein